MITDIGKAILDSRLTLKKFFDYKFNSCKGLQIHSEFS